MQAPLPSTSTRQSSLLADVLHQASVIFTPKRLAYTFAGAFLLVGAAAAMNGGVASQTDDSDGQQHNMQTPGGNAGMPATEGPGNSGAMPNDPTPEDADNAADGNSSTNSTTMQLNVNGRNVPVPRNGTTQRTITNSDGSTTTVNASGNTTTTGDASSSSSSTFNLNIQSRSSSSGG